MADDLIFYTNPMSRGRVVRWLLEELGVKYRTEIIEYGPQMKSPDYLAVNPMGKVPAIIHNGTVVTECAAICTYLADAFPDARLAPSLTSPERGSYLRWMFFAAGPLEAAMTNKSLGFEVPADRKVMAGYGSVEDVAKALSTALLKSPYLTGDKFTAADLLLGSSLGWYLQFNLLEKRPEFEDYTKRLQSRSAAVRAAAIDDALMPPKGG